MLPEPSFVPLKDILEQEHSQLEQQRLHEAEVKEQFRIERLIAQERQAAAAEADGGKGGGAKGSVKGGSKGAGRGGGKTGSKGRGRGCGCENEDAMAIAPQTTETTGIGDTLAALV